MPVTVCLVNWSAIVWSGVMVMSEKAKTHWLKKRRVKIDIKNAVTVAQIFLNFFIGASFGEIVYKHLLFVKFIISKFLNQAFFVYPCNFVILFCLIIYIYYYTIIYFNKFIKIKINFYFRKINVVLVDLTFKNRYSSNKLVNNQHKKYHETRNTFCHLNLCILMYFVSISLILFFSELI